MEKSFTEFTEEKENLMQKEADMRKFSKFVDAVAEHKGDPRIKHDKEILEFLERTYRDSYCAFDDIDSMCTFVRESRMPLSATCDFYSYHDDILPPEFMFLTESKKISCIHSTLSYHDSTLSYFT